MRKNVSSRKKNPARRIGMLAGSALAILFSCIFMPAGAKAVTVSKSLQSYGEYLKKSDQINQIFSPTSMNSAFYMNSLMLEDEDKAKFDAFLENKNYLKIENSSALKSVNRIWVNSVQPVYLPASLSEVGYSLDMSQSVSATAEKNEYVKTQTDGFIPSTPTTFDINTIMDVMNIVYFKDSWKGGDRVVDGSHTTFQNSDGTVTQNVNFIRQYSDNTEKDQVSFYSTDKAHACTIGYENGCNFTIVLPDSGYELKDVDLQPFMGNTAKEVTDQVIFSMPEFCINTTFQPSFSDFDLPNAKVRKEIYNGDQVNSIIQVAKIQVDRSGTEAAAVTEILKVSSALPVQEPFQMICDRPFYYYISDAKNDEILFMGKLEKYTTDNVPDLTQYEEKKAEEEEASEAFTKKKVTKVKIVAKKNKKKNKKNVRKYSVTWKKIKDANGYEVFYAKNKKFTKGKKKEILLANKGKKVLDLKKGSKIFLKVRGYQDASKGKIYTNWSKIQKVKVK